MNLLLWAVVCIVALTFIAAVERAIRFSRRAALRESRQWFEYSLMAAKSADELRGR
jgi:hypothetical protein